MRSIRNTLLLPIAGVVSLAVALGLALAYLYGKGATDDLVERLVVETTDGLNHHLHAFLDSAQSAVNENADALRLGSLTDADLFSRPEVWFTAQLQRYPAVDDIYFARPDGAIAGVDKTDGDLLLKLSTSPGQRDFILLDAQGRRGTTLRSEAYDAASRSWFMAARAAAGPVWSKPYLLQNKNALGLTASRPALDAQSRPVGVMGANIALKSISDYLARHTLGDHSVAYIAETDGKLVAASSALVSLVTVVDGQPQRVLAGRAAHPQVAGSYRALEAAGVHLGHQAFQASAAASGPALPRHTLSFRDAGVDYRVDVSAFEDPRGVRWLLVSVVDPAYFMGGVYGLARNTLLGGLLLLLALSVLVWRASRRLAVPIEALSRASLQIAQGEPGRTVAEVGGGREVSTLVASFNSMSLALRGALDQVQAHATELEGQVGERTAALLAANQALTAARDRAEQASLAKTSFLASISHEIRTPLATISGSCYLLRRGGLNAAQDGRVAALETAAQHLLGVVNSVLDISKIEAGRFELDEGPLRVESLVANVLSMVSGAAAAKGLHLQSAIEPMPAVLLGDRTRLQQMLLNYAANAVKFTEHGHVSVVVKLQDLTEQDAGLRFEVQDSGRPLAPETLARLFMPFEQGEVASAHKQAGAGLGLAITRQLAALMGGAAAAETSAGGGNVFFFTVRLKRAPAQQAKALEPHESTSEAALRTGFAGARVLVAEDDPVNLLITKAMLSQAGLVAETAATGSEAVQRAAEQKYDLILMDLQMPELDGLQATAQIRRSAHNSLTPIIATTANAFLEDRQRCLQAGMSDFLAKPMRASDFFSTVHRWLQRA